MMSVAAFADIARPGKSPKSVKKPVVVDTELDIRLDADAKEARLIIPRSQLAQLRAELERLDDGSDNTAEITSSGDFSRTQTIVSGLFLSLAFIFGGVWFIRSGKAATPVARTLLVLVAIAGIVSAATFVYANAGPPAEARTITGKMFSQAVHMYGVGWGKIKLEVGDEGDSLKLIVPNPKTSPTPSGEE
jgi:hypothetical protein